MNNFRFYTTSGRSLPGWMHDKLTTGKQVSKVKWQEAASPSRRQMDSSPSTWFLGPTVSLQNGISIGSAVFAQLSRVPNRHTDHATCDNCSNRPHLMYCVQAIGPKNNARSSPKWHFGYITPDLTCATSFRCSAPEATLDKLQRVQNNLARIVCQRGWRADAGLLHASAA